MRLRVVKPTDGKPLKRPMARFTPPTALANTDDWKGYNQIPRQRVPVNQGEREWARDHDGAGLRAVHITPTEGLWTGTRNFLRSFRGMHTDYLSGHVAMCEHRINLKRIMPQFIAALVRCN